MISLLSYKQLKDGTFAEGSNKAIQIRDCIAEFELFLINVGIKEVLIDDVPLRYEDFLFFATGGDRIPPYGFDKKIDILFEDISLPKVNTCGLILRLPSRSENLAQKLITSIKYGGGFGEV